MAFQRQQEEQTALLSKPAQDMGQLTQSMTQSMHQLLQDMGELTRAMNQLVGFQKVQLRIQSDQLSELNQIKISHQWLEQVEEQQLTRLHQKALGQLKVMVQHLDQIRHDTSENLTKSSHMEQRQSECGWKLMVING